MLLNLSTWPEVEEHLKSSTGFIVPVGSAEQHGPNGLIGTDSICPEVIAMGLGDRIDALVGPTVTIGVSPHHLGFPGTISLRPSTLIAIVCDTVQSLARHGFDRIYFINGHGGNIAPLETAFSEIYAEASLATPGLQKRHLRCRLRSWTGGARVRRLCQELYGAADGDHANPSEVSLTQFACPDAIKHVEMHPKIPPTGPIFDAADFRGRYPDGRMASDPLLATPEAGKQLYEASILDLAEDYQAFLAAA